MWACFTSKSFIIRNRLESEKTQSFFHWSVQAVVIFTTWKKCERLKHHVGVGCLTENTSRFHEYAATRQTISIRLAWVIRGLTGSSPLFKCRLNALSAPVH